MVLPSARSTRTSAPNGSRGQPEEHPWPGPRVEVSEDHRRPGLAGPRPLGEPAGHSEVGRHLDRPVRRPGRAAATACPPRASGCATGPAPPRRRSCAPTGTTAAAAREPRRLLDGGGPTASPAHRGRAARRATHGGHERHPRGRPPHRVPAPGHAAGAGLGTALREPGRHRLAEGVRQLTGEAEHVLVGAVGQLVRLAVVLAGEGVDLPGQHLVVGEEGLGQIRGAQRVAGGGVEEAGQLVLELAQLAQRRLAAAASSFAATPAV